MYGNDHSYAHSRLQETIVRLKKCGTPILVHSVGRGCVAEVSRIGGGSPFNVDLGDIDVKPIPLGFVNFRGRASYVARMPKRRDWRQGARHNSMVALSGGTPSSRIPYQSLVDTICSNFPTLGDCMDSIKDDCSSMAWHRHWAVGTNSALLYKFMGVVGSVVEGQPILNANKSYLEGYLRESL